jgi:hypothetical protein
MMKKLLLMGAAVAVSTMTVSAQSAVSAKATGVDKKTVEPAKSAATVSGTGTVSGPVTGVPGGSGKATAGTARWYSYADYVGKLTPLDDSLELPYMWHKGNGKAIYSDGSGGLIADTISLASIGMSFDPVFSVNTTAKTLGGFNDKTAGYDPNGIAVTRTDAYTIDSVQFWGIYGRKSTKPSVVDTVRFAIVYGGAGTGSDLPIYYFGGPTTGFPYTAFGYDTVRFAGLGYDKTAGIAKGTTRVIKDLYLRNTDTSLANFRSFAVAVGMNVPAGNIVGISANFITGDPAFRPYVDTVFMGSARPAEPFEFGLIRPMLFAEPPAPFTKSAPGYPQYIPNYYNTGFVKFLPDASSWADMYVPSYAYTPPFSYEMPQLDVKVSCSGCRSILELEKFLSINEVSVIEAAKAFPNPSSTEVYIPFTAKQKSVVTVTVTNMLGQVVATQQMNANAGQQMTATFNTANLGAGMYMYSVEANGQRIGDRFTVAH